MKIANITIGFLFLLFGWWISSVEISSEPHNHVVIATTCIGNGMTCSEFIYCENRNMRVDLEGNHNPVTKRDSLIFNLK